MVGWAVPDRDVSGAYGLQARNPGPGLRPGFGLPERSALDLPEDPLRGGYGVELAIVDLVHGLRILAL